MIKKGKESNSLPAKKRPASISSYTSIHSGIVEVLEAARKTVATSWEIGRRIVNFKQGGSERAEYGKMLIEKLSVDLTKQYKRGFAKANLWNMRAFYLACPDEKILQTLSGELDKKSLRPQVIKKSDGRLKVAIPGEAIRAIIKTYGDYAFSTGGNRSADCAADFWP